MIIVAGIPVRNSPEPPGAILDHALEMPTTNTHQGAHSCANITESNTIENAYLT
jgi:hypothetical protein